MFKRVRNIYTDFRFKSETYKQSVQTWRDINMTRDSGGFKICITLMEKKNYWNNSSLYIFIIG